MAKGQSEHAFDYVIAGAGTAGCVLANRLSEDPGVRVCLIEAGGKDSHPFIHVPALVGAALTLKQLSWGLETVPQENLNGRRIPVPRGRVLGGSSSVNGMVYFRGHAKDYDDWAAAGNAGWSFAEVLPYFLRSENNAQYPGSPFHGHDGPMHVGDVKSPNPLNAVFADAMRSLQFRHCDDFKRPVPGRLRPAPGRDPERAPRIRRHGFSEAGDRPPQSDGDDRCADRARHRREQACDRRGGACRRRDEAHRGQTRGNPERRRGGLAADAAAVGHRRRRRVARARHRRPASPARGRRELPRPRRGGCTDVDGQFPVLWHLGEGVSPRGVWNVLQYLLARQGPFASNVFESHAVLRSTAGLDRPDIQVVFQPARRNQNLFPLPLGHGFAISIVLLHPKSRGRLTLKSADPRALPLIDPKLLSAAEDFEPLLRGLKLARQVFAASAFAPYKASEFLPGTAVSNDDQWTEYVRATAATVHSSGRLVSHGHR